MDIYVIVSGEPNPEFMMFADLVIDARKNSGPVILENGTGEVHEVVVERKKYIMGDLIPGSTFAALYEEVEG